MGILAKLDIAGPVPLVFNAPALPDQPQQCFWRCSQAGDEQVLGLPRFSGQVSGLDGCECTRVDELLLVVDRTEVANR